MGRYMSWLAKNLPSVFIEAPDGSIHFRIVGYCKFIEDNIERVYFFKQRKTYISDFNVEGIIQRSLSNMNKTLIEQERVKNDFQVACLRQELEIVNLEKELNFLKEYKVKTDNDHKDSLEEMINLRMKISKLQGKLEEIHNLVIEKNQSRKEVEEWFNKEIEYREEVIKSLKDTINKFRDSINVISSDINEKNGEQLEKLRKEIEMLDKDFVDVAKAMNVFSKDNDRPLKGFRIKLN
jgi:chromosome segregation ATPase